MKGDAGVIQHLDAVLKNELTAIKQFIETQLALVEKIGLQNYIQLQSEATG